MTTFLPAIATLASMEPRRITGSVAALRGLALMVEDLPVPIGSLVRVGRDPIHAPRGEVVGFAREHAIVMLLAQPEGIRPGDPVVALETAQTAEVGRSMLGRVIDGMGRPIDGRGPIQDTVARPLNPEPISALARRRIDTPMHTGVRAVDLMTTLGKGQRIGLFAGPGVGKSTLLASIATHAQSHVNVIALIGERGREVKDFIEHALGPQGLARSVVIVATGDESPLRRVRAAKLACSAAEFFRDQGLDVMLMMDSVTRFAHAQRQIGLAVGEPPATKGYTPSAFAQLALLLERAGALEPTTSNASGGSITGLYTILVEGDDMTEPVADAARGILDGHIILSRKLAQRAHFPAIDVLDSISRVAGDVTDADHAQARRRILRLLALHRDVEDLVQIGAYARGANPESDIAIDANPEIIDLLRQSPTEPTPFDQSRARLLDIAQRRAAELDRSNKAKPAPARPNR